MAYTVRHTDEEGAAHTEPFAALGEALDRYEALATRYYRWWKVGGNVAIPAAGTCRLSTTEGRVLRYYGSEQGGAFLAAGGGVYGEEE